MITPKNAFADPTSSDVQAQADEARAKLNDMRTQLGQASDAYNQALQEHDAAVAKMDECQAKIDENTAQITDLQGKLSTRARNMYRDGQTTFLDVILGSDTFEDFAKNWDTLQSLNDKDAEMVSETKTLREDNEAQKAEYANQADIAQQKLDEAEAAKNEAEQLVAQYQSEVDSLDSQVAELLEQERKAAEEAAAAAAVQAEASAPAATGGSGSESTGGTGSGSGTADNGGSTGGGEVSGGGSSGGGSESGGGSSSGGSNAYGSSVVAYAQGQLGVPYVWGGTTPGVGLDCSGLTSYCWSAATGIWIGRTTWDQYASAQWVGSPSQAEPGDVLYSGGHVAIAANYGGSSYIHAPQPGEVVCYSSTSWWNPFYAALRWY